MAAIGALAHLVTHLGAMEPMIGASAAISGAMAAAMRFVFQQGGPLALLREGADDAYRVPAASLAATLRDPRFLLFLAVWLGLNALFGFGTISFGDGSRTGNRLAGACRRLFRRPVPVQRVRSGRSARRTRHRAKRLAPIAEVRSMRVLACMLAMQRSVLCRCADVWNSDAGSEH